MKSARTRKRRRDRIAQHQNRGRSGLFLPLQLEHLENRQMLNGTSIVSWEPPAALSTTASDSFSDRMPGLATDSAGNWIAVWTTWDDRYMRCSRSTDNGLTWTDAAPLSGDVTSVDTESPQITTDSLGTWIAVWVSVDSLGGTIGTDGDILFSRSTDVGQTWSDPAPLNTNAATDNAGDTTPQLATDSAGNWIAVWASYNDDYDIFYSCSTDGGVTWTDSAPLNTNALTDSGNDQAPQLTTVGAGNWIAVWTSHDSLGGTIGDDSDILFSHSTDNGATWAPPAALNVNAAIDSGSDYSPQLTTDSAGNWIAVWVCNDSLGGTIGDDGDIVFARSTDAGHTWTMPVSLNSNASTDQELDCRPQVAVDSAGNWIAIWNRYSGSNYDADVYFTHSTDLGVTWSDLAPLNGDADSDSLGDHHPQFAVDLTGTWIAMWTDFVESDLSQIAFARAILSDDANTLFADSFEQGQWNGLWLEDSQNDWFTSTQRSTDGRYSAEVDGSASNATITIAQPLNLTPYDSARVSFDWLIESGLDTGEYLALDFFNGSSWQEVAKLSGNVDTENTWHNELLTIDGQYLVSNFQLRFRAKMSGSDEDANVDNVKLFATPPNTAPTGIGDAYAVNEDTTLIVPAVGVLANDGDADFDALTARLVTNVSHGSLVWHTDGSFSYTPSVNFYGTDSFTYRACDGSDYSTTATVVITVNSVNDAPVADDLLTYSRMNGSRSITLTASDLELDPLTYGVVTPPAHGTLSGTAPDLIYTPDTDYLGMDSFTFRAHDGIDPSNLATVTIDVAVNHLPEAFPQTITLDEDCPQAILLSGTDLDADPLTYHIVDPPQNGTLSGTAPDLVYTPNADFYGSDSFTFLVNDSTDDSLPATVSLTIRPVHDQPPMDFATYIGGTGFDRIEAMALADDGHTFVTGYTSSVDLPNSISGSVYGGGSQDGFVAKIDSAGAVVWTTYLGGSGIDYGRAVAMDGSGNLFVTGYTNSTDLATGYMGGSYDGFVAKIDGTTGTMNWITYLGGAGSDYTRGIAVDGTGNLLVAGYTDSQDLPNPTNGFQGGTWDVFVTKIDAVVGAVGWSTYLGGSGSDRAALYPAIVIDSSQNVFVAGYTNSPDLAHRINDYRGGTYDSFVAKLNSGGAVEWTTYLGGMDLDYAQGITVDGSDNVLVGGYTKSGDLANATNVNHGGYDGYVVKIDAAGSTQWTTYLGGSDDDYANAVATSGSGDVFVTGYSYAAAIGGQDATLTKLDSDTGHVAWMTYLGGTGNDSGVRVATDGEGRVYVAGYTYSTDLPGASNELQGGRDGFLVKLDPSTISPPPAEPPMALGDSYSVSWNRTLQIAAPGVLANDSDPNEDTLTAVLVSGPSSGTLELNSDGSFTFTPAINFSGSDSFTYSAFDGIAPSNVATVTIEVAANHVPVADPQCVSLGEDSSAPITLTGSDADLDPLGFLIIDQPQHGTLTGTAPDVVYMPLANYFGSDSFTFLVSDGTDNSLPATVSLTIQPVNDPPVALGQSVTTDEDTSLPVTLTGSDIELDPLTFQIVSGPSHGTLSGTAPNLLYTPSSDYNGLDSFTFVARDGASNSVPATISLQINPVNDAPVAVDDAASTYQDTAVLIPLLANDSDVDSSSFWIESIDTPAHGTLVNHGNGTVTYTPAAGYLDGDSFGYTVTDGALSDNATVSITVQPGEVTLTYSNTTAKTIRDWSTTTSTIAVPSAMTIADVNVQLSISHTRDQDLDVYLISPSGTRVQLFTDVGGNGDHFSGTILDDQAAASITSGSAPFAGTYRPEGSLAVINGQNAVGTWTLEITDDKLFYSGTLNNWSITLTGSPMALTASGSGTAGSATPITQADAQHAVDQALLWWSTYAQVQTSVPIQVYVSDLPDGLLGLAWGQSFTLDATANGAGWWVDSTPWDHRELVGAASTQMDLLTAVSHEIGHLLGYVHSANPRDVMADTLPVGTRRLPGLGDLGRGGGVVDPTNRTDQTDRTDLVDQTDRTDLMSPLTGCPLVDPLPIGRDRHTGSSDAAGRAQLRAQALAESTALLDDDLLDLLARIDR